MLTPDQISELHRLRWVEQWPLRKIARQMRMKRTPQLRFRIDPAVQSGQKVEDILRGLEEDRG